MKFKMIVIIISMAYIFVGLARASDMEEGDVAYNKGNFSLAISKYENAVSKGDFTALIPLDLMYKKHEGTKKDFQRVFSFIKESAKNGNESFEIMMASAYVDGYLTERNCSEGVNLYRALAAKGNEVAMNNLAGVYWKGNCMPLDYVYVYMWTSMALTRRENSFDRNFIDQLAKTKMTQSQIDEAQKLSRQCFGKKYENCD